MGVANIRSHKSICVITGFTFYVCDNCFIESAHFYESVLTSVATEFSSARLSSDLARATGPPAQLGSARAIFEPARF